MYVTGMSPFIKFLKGDKSMLEAYSLNVIVPAGGFVNFDNINIQKGNSAILSSPAVVDLNSKGVYNIKCCASSEASSTLQLYVDGTAIDPGQSTGSSLAFDTLVTVDSNNCPNVSYSQPSKVQVKNIGDTSATFSVVDIVVVKVC